LAMAPNPGITRVGLFLNLTTPQTVIYRRDTTDAAAKLGVNLVIAEVRGPEDLAGAIDMLGRERADFALFLQDSMFLNERVRIAELMAAARLPALYGVREHAEAGGLMSFGQKLTENYRRAALYVDKVLKGAKPADLPVEFPTGFELVLNLKAAKALGLEFPLLVVAQAEELIE